MNPPSHLPPHNISLGHPHAPAPSKLHPTSDMDWRFNSYMTVYMLECRILLFLILPESRDEDYLANSEPEVDMSSKDLDLNLNLLLS